MIPAHGVPLSLYRDRHSIFQRNDVHWTLAEQLAGKQSPTQLGRALEELGIQQIPAYSPQAKPVLAGFCTDYNQRFARPAADATRDFRSLPRRFDLARCLSLRYQRVVS